MCGLAGFISPSNLQANVLEGIATRMASAIAYRGPDDGGTWVDADAGIALGHRRLAILDLSPAGHQPMVSADGRYVLVFNGEIYNHLTLRRELETAASSRARPDGGSNTIAWRGHADTETLLESFARLGVGLTLAKAVGMFALALWDTQTRTLTLARDRIGEKPLYYGWQRDTLMFGSELKALKAHPDFYARVDRGALTLLLRHNHVPAPYSIYEGLFKLPPGTYLQIQPGQRTVEPVTYWSLADVAQRGQAAPFSGSDNDALATLEQTLSSAVLGQMLSDVPLGAMLSGGIDSSLVAALMQANSKQPVRTFTIGFHEHEYDESTYARAVAKHLGTDHTEVRLSGDNALALVPQLPAMYDEPFADCSQLPTHLVMRLARQHVTVALSGDGGDESFGGYNRYHLAPQVWRRTGWMPQPLRSALGTALSALPATAINRWSAPLARWLNIHQPGDKLHKLGHRLHALRSVDDLYVSLVTEWPQVADIVLGATVPPTLVAERARWPQLADPVARMMALDTLSYLPDDILVKVDRAAMAVSLETRAPFLDRDVVAFAWSLPAHMKVRDGQGKWLLRQLLDRHIPRALLERPKMGFGIPLDAWLRGPLKDWAEDLLAEDRLRREGYFHPLPIRSAWQEHLGGRANHGYRLWSVLMFQAWLEANG